MSVTILLYDDTLVEVTDPRVEFEEQDGGGVTIDSQLNILLSPGTTEYGARLRGPSPACPVIVWIDDRSGCYAPVSLGRLNGAKAVTMHVTLFPLPPPAVSLPPCVPTPPDLYAVDQFIARQVNSGQWSTENGEGVRTLAETITRAWLLRDRSATLESRLERWSWMLSNFLPREETKFEARAY